LTMMRVQQDPIDFIDAAVPDAIFTRTETDVSEVLFDLGDGAKSSAAASGSIAYYPAETEARTRVEVPHALAVLAFPQKALADLMARERGDPSGLERRASRMTEMVVASRLMDEIWNNASGYGAASNLYLDGLALQFLAVMAGSTSFSPLGPDNVEDRRIARAIDYLEAHIAEPLAVAELANVAALSPSQFARVFKATTGEAVWAFVQRRRIERARDMLRNTTNPISQIAFDCGFSSQNHMANLFRRHLDTTPGAVRDAS